MELVILLALYMLPTIVGNARKSKRTGGIAILNLFFGWMIIPWFLALIWAASSDVKEVR